MNFKGHSTGGAVSALTITVISIATTFDILLSAIYGAVTYLMSLYPDVDIKSKSLKVWMALGLPSVFALVYFEDMSRAGVLLAMLMIPQLCKHRGLTHTVKIGAVVSYGLFYIISGYIEVNLIYIMVAGVVGHLTHLLLDKHFKF